MRSGYCFKGKFLSKKPVDNPLTTSSKQLYIYNNVLIHRSLYANVPTSTNVKYKPGSRWTPCWSGSEYIHHQQHDFFLTSCELWRLFEVLTTLQIDWCRNYGNYLPDILANRLTFTYTYRDRELWCICKLVQCEGERLSELYYIL